MLLALFLSAGVALIAWVVARFKQWDVVKVPVNVLIVLAGFLGVCEVLTGLILRCPREGARPTPAGDRSTFEGRVDSNHTRERRRRSSAAAQDGSQLVGMDAQAKARELLDPKKAF